MQFILTRRRLVAAVPLLALTATPALPQGDAPVIAAAASLEFALTEVAARFVEDTGMQIRLSFGSTGNISRQIQQGAPFELFLAADDGTPLALHAEGHTPDAGAVYAVGRIALAAPHGSPLDPRAGLDGLDEALSRGEIRRFAIANPEHAPFGIAAREALMRRGLWEDLEPLLVLGENVSQAAAFALSGNAEGGIVAWSLALAPQVAERGSFTLIPEDWHAPLRQRMVLLNGAGPVAEAFHAYLTQPAARAILARYGFVLPEA